MIKFENLLFLAPFHSTFITQLEQTLVWFQSFFETFKQMINHKQHMELESELAPASRVGLIV
jgi:hypothetical protein